MIDREIAADGAATFWSLAEWTDRKSLLERLGSVGLGKFCPEVRTNMACLRSALSDVFHNSRIHHFTIKPVKRDGFAIYKTTTEEFAVRDEHVTTVKVDPAARMTFHSEVGDAKYCNEADEILYHYNSHIGLVTNEAVSSSLVQIVCSLAGLTLRPTGSFYWIPSAHLDTWKQASEAVEWSGVHNQNRVYLLRTRMDSDALRAVTDALRNEVQSEAVRIEKEIAESELGDRALENRQRQATRLRNKIAEYEEMLGVSLTDLTVMAEKAEQAAATAVLMGSAVSG